MVLEDAISTVAAVVARIEVSQERTELLPREQERQAFAAQVHARTEGLRRQLHNQWQTAPPQMRRRLRRRWQRAAEEWGILALAA